MSDQERQDTPQGEEQEVQEGQIRYGYDTQGNFSVDLGDGYGPVAVDKVNDPRLEFLPAPTIPEEIQRELELGREARQVLEEAEPILKLSKKENFKEWLKEQVEMGYVEDPHPIPRPGPEDVMGTATRRQDPAFEEIRQAMIEYAQTLDERDQELLMNNHAVFNATYDKFKAARGNRPPIVPRTTGAPLNWERSIAAKEVLKDQARVEPPGGIPTAPDPQKDARRKLDYWRSRMNDRSLTPTQRSEAEHEMAKFYVGDPDARRGRR